MYVCRYVDLNADDMYGRTHPRSPSHAPDRQKPIDVKMLDCGLIIAVLWETLNKRV